MSSFCTIKTGQEVTNNEIREEFKCGNMGGMRRSKRTNSLMIISDHTKGLYDDKWQGDVLHYTGMGKSGDQSLDFAQNKTLAQSRENGVEVHLFEVLEPTKYIYRGEVELTGEPYKETQRGEDGLNRNVWMFPLKTKICGQSTPISVIKKNQERKEKQAKRLSDSDLKQRIAVRTGRKTSTRNVTTPIYERDEDIAEYAKRRASGVCQLCGQPAPFIKRDGKPYLESHHVEPLADGGSDTIDNVVALCANCHRKMHSLELPEDIEKLKIKAAEKL